MRIRYFFPALIMVLTSCHSVYYYRTRAVGRAREYVLENVKTLPETKRDYVRYTTPQIMSDRIFFREGRSFKARKDLMQTCIVWDIPDFDKSLVVFGVSERDLDDWYPVRVVWKKFVKEDKLKNAAIIKARDYAMQKMLFLKVPTRNRIRFSAPTILKTDFDIDIKPGLKKKYINLTQYSLVWDAEKKDEKVVIIGISEPNFKRWKNITGTLKQNWEIRVKFDDPSTKEKK